jgi:hypothetical protein
MHNADTLGFCKRRDGDSPVFVGTVQAGRPLPQPSIVNGTTVVLKKGSERVLVHSVQPQSNGSFVGKIFGFEPSLVVEFDTMKIDDQIVFREPHVISCGD